MQHRQQHSKGIVSDPQVPFAAENIILLAATKAQMMHAGYPGQYTDTRATVDCKYFLEGRCTLGDNCPFRHRPDKFNTATRARTSFPPGSQPQPCHFFLNGKCTKGADCPFQHPTPAQSAPPGLPVQPQDEMHIDFEDDESPRQPEQPRPAKTATPKPLPVQARLGSNMQQNQALQQAAQQPLLTRLKPQQGVHSRLDPAPQNPQRRPPHSTTAEQDDTALNKGSVFERLSMSRSGTALDRLSIPGQASAGSRSAASARPRDARELLMQSIEAKARVGRKETELVRPGAAARSPGQAVRQGASELQPASIAARRLVQVNRGAKASPAPVHAPKFASPATAEGSGRKSALERLARPQQNGTASPSGASTPATAGKPRRASVVPFTSTRMRPHAPSSQTPSQSQPPAASGAETSGVTPVAGLVPAATPASEHSTGGVDKRGRQRIMWQPPTAAQREEDAQEARANVTKRKASDATSPAFDTAVAVAAEEVSPAKRIKAQPDFTDTKAAPKGHAEEQDMMPTEARAADQQEADTVDLEPVHSSLDAVNAELDESDQGDLDDDLEAGAEDDVLYEDDFDDEATMRELEALA